MKNVIQSYLKEHGLTINEIAKISGIAQSTLQSASEKPLARSSVKVAHAFATAVGKDIRTFTDEIWALEDEVIKTHPIKPLQEMLEDHKIMYLNAIDKLWNGIIDSKVVSVSMPVPSNKKSLCEKINNNTPFEATYDDAKQMLIINNQNLLNRE